MESTQEDQLLKAHLLAQSLSLNSINNFKSLHGYNALRSFHIIAEYE